MTIWTKAEIKEIRDKEVIVKYKGSENRVGADTVVVAAGSEPDRQFLERMQGTVSEIFVVGDCIKPRRVLEAIAEGFKVGVKI